MPAQIDWKAEDEQAWGEFEPDNGPAPGGRRPSRRLRLIVLAVVVVAGLATVAYWQVSRFLDSSASEVEEALLDSHALVMEAAANGDGDLVRDLILDRLEEWTEASVLLAEQGLWLDRQPLDLYLAESTSPPVTEVTLDPALDQAVVTMTVTYRVGANEAAADTVRLRQLFAYRYRDERWLLNPPTGAFWGSREATSGRYLTLSYPERDADLGRRLAADLEAALGQACHTVAMMDCGDDLHLVVDLLADPAVLVELADPAWQLSGGQSINLPTPTLVGLPEGESAYRAIYRGYAQRVVSRLVARQTMLAETTSPLVALALSERILQRLGLQAGTGTPGLIIYDGQTVVGRLETLWNNETPAAALQKQDAAQLNVILVDFLVERWSDIPETEMLRALAQSGSWQEWLRRLAPDKNDGMLHDAWENYIAEHNPRITAPAWPDELVLMMCDQGVIGSASLYQYDPTTKVITKVLSGREFIRMERLPDGNGVKLTEQLISQAGQRTYLWRDGRLSPYEGEDGQLSGDISMLKRETWARPAQQNDRVALSGDGLWLAELGQGTLILSSLEGGYREVIPHAGQSCRGVAWLQAPAGHFSG